MNKKWKLDLLGFVIEKRARSNVFEPCALFLSCPALVWCLTESITRFIAVVVVVFICRNASLRILQNMLARTRNNIIDSNLFLNVNQPLTVFRLRYVSEFDEGHMKKRSKNRYVQSCELTCVSWNKKFVPCGLWARSLFPLSLSTLVS